jgi:hypothetical protein
MSKLQSKDFLNISCIVEGKITNYIRDKIGNFNKNISTTYVPVKDVYKTGGKSGLIGLGLGAIGGYALGGKPVNNVYIVPPDSDDSHSIHNGLLNILKDAHHEK